MIDLYCIPSSGFTDASSHQGIQRVRSMLDESFMDSSAVVALGLRGMDALVRTIVASCVGNDDGGNCDSSAGGPLYCWIKCDDDTLSIVEEEDVTNSPAYVLFYSPTPS